MKRDTAIFFDIHRHPQREPLTMELDEFLNSVTKGQLFDTDAALVECPPLPAADTAMQLESMGWVQLQAALVWALTGKIADKETIYPYRDVYRSLLKKHRLQNTFRNSVLIAYLICGIRLKRNGWSGEDKNTVEDFKAFCERLLDPSRTSLSASTFMCAHREADEEDANKLVKVMKTESFERAMHVIKGVVHNVDHTRVSLTIYHLDSSKYSLLAIFPNIIHRYCETDGLGALLDTLGRQYDEIRDLAAELSSDKLELQLLPTDQHISDTRKLCVELGGPDWRTLTPSEAERTLADPYLHEIIEAAAMEEVSRYMPEYGAAKIDGLKTGLTGSADDKEIIDWYAEQERLTPYAKALYETLFYNNWGRHVRATDGIAIGIDRDHSDFQIRAFHTGYTGEYAFGSSAPVVYLRRSDREIGRHDIHALSLRQFWRYSGDNKR